MKIKAIAFDMDGTLLMTDQSIHPETIAAINEASNKGIKIILASGRPYKEMTSTADLLGCVDFIVANNGACLYDVKKKEFLEVKTLPSFLFDFVRTRAKETGSLFAVHTQKNAYRQLFFELEGAPKWAAESVDEVKNFSSSINMDDAAKNEPITQLSFKNDKEVIKVLKKEIEDDFSQEVTCHIGNEVYLDINTKNTTKLTGITTVLESTDITLEQIMAFGDSGNDLQMVGECGHGVSMGNGTEELKALAKDIIGNHNSDTIGKKIREMIS